MTFHRRDQTPGAQIVVPGAAVFFCWTGLSHLCTPLHTLLLTPALRAFHREVDLRVWGVLFLAVTLWLVIAMLTPGSSRAQPMAAYALLFGSIVMAVWMVFLVGASVYGEAAPGAGAYAFFPAVACYGTYRSIARDM